MDTNWITVDFLGDSITEIYCASKAENAYCQVVARLLNLKNAINDGICGTRIARQKVPSEIATFDLDFNMRADNLKKDADLVIVFGGTNDYGHGDAPFGTLEDYTIDTFCGAFKCLLIKLIAMYGKEKVAVILPLRRFNCDNPFGDGCKKVKGEILKVYHDAEKTIADSYGVKSLDLWDDEDMNPYSEKGKGNFADGLHPNDSGHKVLGEKVAAFIRSL